MKIIAIAYLILFLISLIREPFTFGDEKEPNSPQSWLVTIAVSSPLIYFLANYILTQ